LSPLVGFLLPAHITALSIALLLYANDRLVPVAFATALAVGSKYVFRVRVNGSRRHLFNPSNFGLAVTFLLFPWIGLIPPYHFTENLYGLWYWLLPLAILASGTMLHVRLTGRWPLVIGWVGGFLAQALVRSVVFGTPLIAPLVPMTGVAFWLYTNYMITDPGTTPVVARRQVVFGAATAAVYGVLVTAHVVFGFFFALVVVSAARGIGLSLRSRAVVSPATVEPRPALEAVHS
jgi:Na+-transporting NADH:ubiquinone oxidoreductase subunit NqrB